MRPLIVSRWPWLLHKRRHSFTTNPIFYANAAPHLGHLYTALLSDAHSRWQRLKQPRDNHILSVGTDEHGLKILNTARALGRLPQQHCDEVSAQFSALFSAFNVSHTHFIRTTEQRHKLAVQHFWNVLTAKDMLYKNSYEGWYSQVDECFYGKDEVEDAEIDGKRITISKETRSEVQWTREENYMFRLTQFIDRIKYWIEKEEPIHPSHFVPAIKQLLLLPADLSVSRPRSRLSWGIAVPEDEEQTIYVWLDALVNYLTLAGYPNKLSCWPPTCQIIGKDILKFHSIYWPAFLLAADLPLPKRLFVHGHWLVDNKKMSKSLGNVVSPFEAGERFTREGLRYFLLRQGVPHEDSNYSEKKALDVINADLVNNAGNLLSRSTIQKLNPKQEYPYFDEKEIMQLLGDFAIDLLDSIHRIMGRTAPCYDELMFYKGLEHVMALLKQGNLFFQQHMPWKMQQGRELECVLYLTYESLRLSALLLQPIIPQFADKCLTRLGVSPKERDLSTALLDGGKKSSRQLGASSGSLMDRLK